MLISCIKLTGSRPFDYEHSYLPLTTIIMTQYSCSSASSNNRMIVHRPSQNHPERRMHNYGKVVSRSKSKQLATPVPYALPSTDELDRLERYMAIQERMARLKSMPRQGHTYGKVTVSGNAKAIRGNLYDDSTPTSCLRSHTYGEAITRDGGMVWDGDICVSAFERQTSRSTQ